MATFTNLAFTANGTYQVFAATSSDLLGELVSVNVTSAPAIAVTHLAVAVSPSNPTAGQPVQVTVAALNAKNQPVTSFNDSLQFTAAGGVSVNLPFTSTTGSQTFSLTLTRAGSQTISVTDNEHATIKGSSPKVTVSAGTASGFVLTPAAGPVVFGVPETMTIAAVDGNNNPTTFAGSVQLAVTAGQAVVPATVTLTGGSGKFSFTAQSLGTVTIGASAGNNAGSLTVNVVSAATHLAINGVPAVITAGQSFPLTVAALNKAGLNVSAFTDVLHFTDTAGPVGLPADAPFSGSNGQESYSFTLPIAGKQTLTVTDVSSTGVKSASVTLTVAPAGNGTRPIAGINLAAGTPTVAVRGQPMQFVLSATETGQPTGAFTWSINWGDGSPVQIVAGASGIAVTHVFAATGKFTPAVTVTNAVGNTSQAPATVAVTIDAVALEADPANANEAALFIGGTTGNDTIVIAPADPTGKTVTVTINGVAQSTTPFAPTGHILVYGQAGKDTIEVVSQVINGQSVSVAVPALLFAGSGSSTLSVAGSSANNVLVGGAGNNLLTGGSGQDILIGGPGADTLHAGRGGDILIDGTTTYDSNVAALCAIVAEWGRTDLSYEQRVQDLFGGSANALNAQSVLTNRVTNQVLGGANLDWFWLNIDTKAVDKVGNLATGEAATFE